MATPDAAPAAANPRRHLWRVILIVLMLLPAVPGILLFAISAYGKLSGCDVTAASCLALGETAKRALDTAAVFASFFVFLGVFWFGIALLPIHYGFAGPGARLLIALFAAGWSVLGAIVAGLIGLSSLAPHCSFNEGGVGTCNLFGVATTSGHHIGTAIWGVLIGVPLAGLAFVLYAIAIAIVAARSKPKTLTFRQR